MADQKVAPPQKLEDRLNNFEHWVDENRKVLTYVVGGLFVVVAAYFGFTKLYLDPKNDEANNQSFMAQKWFGMDSLNLALNGDGNFPGFLSIMDEYKWTEAANLAHYYTGVIYLKQGKFEDAIDQLKDFHGKDKMVSNMAYGAIGDAYSELGKNDEAIDYYKKAAYHFENELTTPMFLKKAGMLLEYTKKNAEAKKLYEEIKSRYPNTNEGREMDKYIARVEAGSNS
ncbi:MAG: tetratricopeptide repeat protein [Chitinophagales bacterium]|nr:tetratricopeptide repeat protein [Bacteroidota bacterium]MBX7141911.1 tetratricopeptide repeat protein [Chitinophagales bacterium]